jgi:uncharacterized protein YjbI with pentapeptide repeats
MEEQLPIAGTPVGASAQAQPPLASKADDLESIRSAVMDAAGVSGGFWLSYLLVLFYLLIAAGGVTHRDLFLDNPVKLPFLGVDLPLKGFFWLAPALFLIVHAYVLLHFVMLADKIRLYDTELRDQIADLNARTRLRQQLPSNIFVQFLAGPSEVRHGTKGYMLQLIALISLVIGPVALLVFIQLQFLPYHDALITWWQCIAVVLDIVLLWKLWPGIARRETDEQDWRSAHKGIVVSLAAAASVMTVLLVFTIATFPGEWLNRTIPALRFLPLSGGWTSLHELLVAGSVDTAARKPTSLWSNRLVLAGLDVIDHAKFNTEEKIAALPETVSLRTRHLEGAVLIDAVLRKADFTSAHLQGAILDRADLRGAKLSCPERIEDILQGESRRASPTTEEDCTMLQGASLNDAQLQGASLEGAQLQGASLASAQLQGTWLLGANLQGASLDGAQLQGATLAFAQLQGAWILGAQMQGADLLKANFYLAFLSRVFVWRADIREARWSGAFVKDARTGRQQECDDGLTVCDFSSLTFQNLKMSVEHEVPKRDWGSFVRMRFASILDPEKSSDRDQPILDAWKEVQLASPPEESYATELAAELLSLGCIPNGTPYVLSGLIRNRRERSLIELSLASTPKNFLSQGCSGARSLPDQFRR